MMMPINLFSNCKHTNSSKVITATYEQASKPPVFRNYCVSPTIDDRQWNLVKTTRILVKACLSALSTVKRQPFSTGST